MAVCSVEELEAKAELAAAGGARDDGWLGGKYDANDPLNRRFSAMFFAFCCPPFFPSSITFNDCSAEAVDLAAWAAAAGGSEAKLNMLSC